MSTAEIGSTGVESYVLSYLVASRTIAQPEVDTAKPPTLQSKVGVWASRRFRIASLEEDGTRDITGDEL